MADNTSTSSIEDRIRDHSPAFSNIALGKVGQKEKPNGGVPMKSDSRYEPKSTLERNLQQVLLRAASESSPLTKDVKQALQQMFPNIGSGDRISPDWTDYVHWNAHEYKSDDDDG